MAWDAVCSSKAWIREFDVSGRVSSLRRTESRAGRSRSEIHGERGRRLASQGSGSRKCRWLDSWKAVLRMWGLGDITPFQGKAGAWSHYMFVQQWNAMCHGLLSFPSLQSHGPFTSIGPICIGYEPLQDQEILDVCLDGKWCPCAERTCRKVKCFPSSFIHSSCGWCSVNQLALPRSRSSCQHIMHSDQQVSTEQAAFMAV